MRRKRLVRRHLLEGSAADSHEVVHALVALHSSDPSTVYLSIRARVPHFEVAHLERELYESKSLLRVYGMRRTLWVIDRSTLPLVDRSSTNVIAESNRRQFEKMIVKGGLATDGTEWTDRVMNETLAALRRRGEALARDLTGDVPDLANKLEFHNQKGELIGSSGVSTRALVQLALESEIVRGRPVGSWISSQYKWVPMEAWLGGPIPAMEADVAAAGLVERWLQQFGPATTTDIKWWTGWTVARVKKALADIAAEEVELDEGTGWVLPSDLDSIEPDLTSVALLPSLDPTTMGWKEREWYLGRHYPLLFDRNGNAGPTVWVDGRVVGGWAQRKTGEVVYEIIEDIGAEATAEVEAKARELTLWMGDVVVTPRFRSPHEKGLAG